MRQLLIFLQFFWHYLKFLFGAIFSSNIVKFANFNDSWVLNISQFPPLYLSSILLCCQKPIMWYIIVLGWLWKSSPSKNKILQSSILMNSFVIWIVHIRSFLVSLWFAHLHIYRTSWESISAKFVFILQLPRFTPQFEILISLVFPQFELLFASPQSF